MTKEEFDAVVGEAFKLFEEGQIRFGEFQKRVHKAEKELATGKDDDE